ncbi:MAG: NADH-quinone oxidoreductase subunit N [Chloroflexota bacterium]|nr:NADH-quinone oxidoreductase subunit N [Chloroflexota bacterium]
MPINAPSLDLGALAPFLVLVTGAGIALLLDLFIPPSRRRLLGYFALATVLVAIGACVPLWSNNAPRLAFADMVNVDRFGLFFSLLTLVATALSILLAIDYLDRHDLNWGEYYPLILFTASGMLLLALANDLILLFISLEVLSIGLYILSGFARGQAGSQESAIKYFLLGSFSFGFLVYGTALVYGATGTTNFTGLGEALAAGGVTDNPLLLVGLALLLVGFAFKLALAPFHMWTPDVYTGAPTTVTAFMSVGTKVTTFGALLRMILSGMPALSSEWAATLWALAIVTMILGNLAAITQRNIKRMLAYSSVGQAGYVLVAVVAAETQRRDVSDAALNGVLFYLLAYTFMNLGAFAVVIALARPGDERLDLDRDYSGLAWRHPWLAGALALFMLSLGGIPPTAGFIGKLLVFRAAIEAGYWTLALVGVLTSVIALGFYLRVVIRMYTGAPARDDRAPLRLPVPLAATLALCAVLTIGLGVLPAVPLDFAQQALTIVRP